MSCPGPSRRDWVLPSQQENLGKVEENVEWRRMWCVFFWGQRSPATCLPPTIGISPFFPAFALMSSLSSKFKSG